MPEPTTTLEALIQPLREDPSRAVSRTDPRFEVHALEGARYALSFWGRFPPSWCGALSLSLSQVGLAVAQGFAKKMRETFWVAECEICAVPMVVWRNHDPAPPEEVRAILHARLAAVVERHFGFEHYVDDHMRNIPDHYHAHARPRGGFFGHGWARRT